MLSARRSQSKKVVLYLILTILCACIFLGVKYFEYSHKFEEGLLYIHVRFTDKTELCWRITTSMTIEEGDLADWTSGDFRQLRVFVRNERDGSV